MVCLCCRHAQLGRLFDLHSCHCGLACLPDISSPCSQVHLYTGELQRLTHEAKNVPCASTGAAPHLCLVHSTFVVLQDELDVFYRGRKVRRKYLSYCQAFVVFGLRICSAARIRTAANHKSHLAEGSVIWLAFRYAKSVLCVDVTFGSLGSIPQSQLVLGLCILHTAHDSLGHLLTQMKQLKCSGSLRTHLSQSSCCLNG